MSKKEKRSYPMETDTLPGMKLTRAGRLAPQEHEAYIKSMERSGLNERQQKELLDRLIERLKGI